MECWGRVWRRQSHKIQSPSRPRALPQLRQEPRTLMGSCLRLIYLADRIPDRLGTGWWSCFCYVPLAGVRKSTNKQGDLTRRNISTPSKRKKNRWITPESTIAWAPGPGRAANQGQSRLQIVLEEGLDGGYKCQLSVKFKAFCELSVKWSLNINYETYLYIFMQI